MSKSRSATRTKDTRARLFPKGRVWGPTVRMIRQAPAPDWPEPVAPPTHVRAPGKTARDRYNREVHVLVDLNVLLDMALWGDPSVICSEDEIRAALHECWNEVHRLKAAIPVAEAAALYRAECDVVEYVCEEEFEPEPDDDYEDAEGAVWLTFVAPPPLVYNRLYLRELSNRGLPAEYRQSALDWLRRNAHFREWAEPWIAADAFTDLL